MTRSPSVKYKAPASSIRPISAMRWPSSARVADPATRTLTRPSAAPRRWMKSTMAGSSMAGSVSGWTTIVVTPPAAADRAADLRVSFGSAPGSPVFTRMSIRPGDRQRPWASTTSTPSGAAAPPPCTTSTMRPASTSTAPGPS